MSSADEQQKKVAESVSASTDTTAEQQQWPTDPSQYDFVGKIGRGAFATVWRATVLSSPPSKHDSAGDGPPDEPKEQSSPSDDDDGQKDTECAVKVLNLDHVDTNLTEIRQEVQSMRLSSHPNILTCYTAFICDVNLWLITPLMRKGSSLHCLQSARHLLAKQYKQQQQQQQQQSHHSDASQQLKPISSMEDHIFYILHETLLGLQYIHENGQIHRDVKAGNILLDRSGQVKIADFGVSGWLIRGGEQIVERKAKTFVGTPCWMSPEVMEQVAGYDYKADIWSLGITALELAKGYAPYARYPPMKVLILTIQEDPPSLDSYDADDIETEADDFMDEDYCDVPKQDFSQVFRQFVSLCLQKNITKRPTCEDLLGNQKLFGRMNVDASVREARRNAMKTQVCDIVPDVGSRRKNELKQQQPTTPSGEAPAAAAASSRPPSHPHLGHHDTDSDSDHQNRMLGQPRKFPGNSPISILLEQQSAENKDRPAGTTWVFADGSSQVFTSSITSANHGADNAIDDVMNDLDEFGKQTGGEHYGTSETAAGIDGGGDGETTARPTTPVPPTSPTTTKKTNHDANEDTVKATGTSPRRQKQAQDVTDDLSQFMDEFELNTAGEHFSR